MYFLAAISIGLLGSLHCLGMCGPIVATVNRGSMGLRYTSLYHGGRLLTYATFGALAGAVGHSIDLMGYQQLFSVVVGILLVVSVAAYPFVRTFKQVESAMGRLTMRFSSWIHGAGLSRSQVRFLMGVVNGILPCGLVYLAVAGAANTFTPWDGALFMVAFGIGTMPVLAVVGKLADRFSPAIRSRARKLIPITLLVMGSLLIVRGMNIGIPYLSPKASVESNEVTDCH